MKQKPYIIISPDIDTLFIDANGCCSCAYGDEIDNDDYELGPCFSIVIPGIEEWLERYENATDFANISTDPNFDWKSWHVEGLRFAKQIRLQMPPVFDLFYRPPFEDTSGTLVEIEVDDKTVDDLIRKLGNSSSYENSEPAVKHHVRFNIISRNNHLYIESYVGKNKQCFSVATERLIRWIKSIEVVEREVISIDVDKSLSLIFFNTTIGIHRNMGQFWIYDRNRKRSLLSAYVDKKEFIRNFRMSMEKEKIQI